MLSINNLTITHQKDLRELIKDLTLLVNAGDKLAIIGEEGTGKSTLIKAIVDKNLITSYAVLEGHITNQFHQIGYLPQNLTPQQLEQSVTEFLYSNLQYDQFDFNLFYKMADTFHLDLEQFEKDNQTMASLSGGEKLKIQLVKILALDPDLLILDEPSSDLDLESIKWLESFIRHSDKTILFISHDESLLAHAATAVLHLELLKKRTEAHATYFHGSYETYRTERKERFERQLQIANKEREDHAKKMRTNQQIQNRVQQALRNTKNDVEGRLLAKKMHVIQAQKRRFNKESEQFTEIPQDMDAINLFFSDIQALPASKVVLFWENKRIETGQSIQLHIQGQDKVVITGQNGIGKTRLLKEILQDLQKRQDLSVGYMPQNYEEALSSSESALSFLTDITAPQSARTLLASLRFTREEITHPVSHLSGGQKAKLFLAKMVLAGNNVLILDEPTRHFSPTSQPLIRQLLRNFPGCIISVSHDRAYMKEVAQHTYRLDSDTLTQMD